MRVLQITAFSGWGCTGRIALGINSALISEGNEGVIAWGRVNTAPENVKTIRIGNAFDQKLHGLYTRLTDKCGFGSRNTTVHFIKLIDEYKPDIIQLHIMHGYYLNLEILFDYIKEKSIPVVWTFHDCWAFTGHCPYFDLIACDRWKTGCHDCPQKKHHPSSWFLDNSKWNWDKKKEIYGRYEKLTIVTPSKWLANLTKQSFLSDRTVLVINNGINLNDFHPRNNTNIKAKYKIENKKVILGVSSSWSSSKGLNDFIKLSSCLDNRYKIVLVGLTNRQKSDLPLSIVGIERTDSIEELSELYSAADVFVNPTYEDNYPTTNLEALACGTPVITYETGGSPEAIVNNGNGIIVEQGNISQLKEAIELVITSPNTCSCELGFLDQKEKFKEYVSLYQEIISNEGSFNE